MADGKPRNRNGIDGWLLVFLVACAGFSLYYLITYASLFRIESDWDRYRGETLPLDLRITEYAFAGARIALPLVIIWRMVARRRWSTIRLVIALVWLLFIGLPAIDYMIATIRFGPIPAGAHPERAFGFGLAFAALATAYLLGSRRVALTYRRPGMIHVDGVFD